MMKRSTRFGETHRVSSWYLGYPEDHVVDPSGRLTSSPDETPIAAPAEEPGEVEEGDTDERDEGGEDEDEVDVEAGRGVKRTLEHMVTHRFANPYCDACVRAKTWGGLVTFDFLTPERVGQLGNETDTNVFFVRDVYSGVRMAYPISGFHG